MDPQPETFPSSPKGVMQQIREHLEQGKSSQEVIALGYAPGSVYKVQRQIRRKESPGEKQLAQVSLESLASETASHLIMRLEILEAEHAQLRSLGSGLLEQEPEDNNLECKLGQLEHVVQDLVSKREAANRASSTKADDQQNKIDLLERRSSDLEALVSLLLPLVYHLDYHHRRATHGWPTDPADQELGLSDSTYNALLQKLQHVLSQSRAVGVRNRRITTISRFRGYYNHPQP
jgi:hypothetical protein